MMQANKLLMYSLLADRFHLVTAPADYAPEAAWITTLIERYADAPAHTLLELGSGGGHNALHLKRRFAVTLSDLAPAMLEASRRINPELPHHLGDMRTLRLGQTFDAVLIHDAIDYMLSADDVRAALATARAHLRPGGVLIVQPDHLVETYTPSTDCGGHDAPDGSGVRYLEWSHAPDGHIVRTDYIYALRHANGRLETLAEAHHTGLFAHDDWLEMLRASGLRADSVSDPPTIEGERVTFIGVA